MGGGAGGAARKHTESHRSARELGRGLHSSTFQLNLSRFGHTSPCPAV